MSAWYEEDELWEVMAPAMFHERRLAIAPDDVENALKWLNLSEGAAVLDLCSGIPYDHNARRLVAVARKSMENGNV